MPIVTILALLAPVATASPPDVKAVCQTMERHYADGTAKPVRPHPLTKEPHAKQILTVLRTVDGCTKPVVIREDVGPSRP